MTDDRRLARDGEVEAGARSGAAAGGDDRTVLVFGAVPEEQALRGRELGVHLDVIRPPLLRALEGPLVLRPQAARVDGEELVLVRPLVGEEVVRLVLHDRAADSAAVLIAPVIGLRRLEEFLRGDGRIAEEQ